ncbi:hypothetical protein GCM10007981_09910 [Thermocladium modestius]|uniref:Uncharacterized protein n=1 Tax=Thermocladium modestius TaxID=62609 RepID=A0A830GTT1_9CREN|nr:hypothetical protein GCM10007981_09910 [Thermocladium modestius]
MEGVAPLGGNPVTGRSHLSRGFHAWGLRWRSFGAYKNATDMIHCLTSPPRGEGSTWGLGRHTPLTGATPLCNQK